MILSVNVSYDACIYMYIPQWAKNRKNVEMNDVFQNSYSRTGTSSAKSLERISNNSDFSLSSQNSTFFQN